MAPSKAAAGGLYWRNDGEPKAGAAILKSTVNAKILVQKAEQQMVLPDAVDAEVAPRHSFAGEAAFLQHADRGGIGGNAGGLDAVQIQFADSDGSSTRSAPSC